MDESSDGSSSSERPVASSSRTKLGDSLFSSGVGASALDRNVAKLAESMGPDQINKIIANEAPEFNMLVQEFLTSLDTLNNKLQPLLSKASSHELQTKHGMTYLEMKYNLLLSYCTFLSFYLLLKLEGKSVAEHPVVFKLTHIKTLLEKLKPLDQKLQYQIEKAVRTAAIGK